MDNIWATKKAISKPAATTAIIGKAPATLIPIKSLKTMEITIEPKREIDLFVDTVLEKLTIPEQKFVTAVVLGDDPVKVVKQVYNIYDETNAKLKNLTLMAIPEVAKAIAELQKANADKEAAVAFIQYLQGRWCGDFLMWGLIEDINAINLRQ